MEAGQAHWKADLLNSNLDDYNCVILPGIINPLPALYDNKLINFLAELKNRDILIAAISSYPILLAKAGILDEVKFIAVFLCKWRIFLNTLIRKTLLTNLL